MPSAPPTPTTPQSPSAPERDPIDRVVVPVTPLGDALTSVIGLIQTPVSAEGLRGPGRGGNGAGGGDGDGDGPGKGPGLGPGSLGGTGEGPYRDGDLGVSRPIAITIVQPRYNNEAMRARVQGTAVVECIVRPDGLCSDIRIRQSVDSTFGLDAEAKRAVAQWRFKPGTRFGQPVAVLIRVELQFTMR